MGITGHNETGVGRGAWGVGRIGRNGVAVGRMIMAYSRGDGAAANYEVARVTVALQHPRVGDDS
jgi:hypothetical protein